MTRRKVTKISSKCRHCGETFSLTKAEQDSGRKVYCNRECFKASRTGQKRKPYKNSRPEERQCGACGESFLVGGRGNAKRAAVAI